MLKESSCETEVYGSNLYGDHGPRPNLVINFSQNFNDINAAERLDAIHQNLHNELKTSKSPGKINNAENFLWANIKSFCWAKSFVG